MNQLRHLACLLAATGHGTAALTLPANRPGGNAMRRYVSLFSLFRAIRRNAVGLAALFVTVHLLAAEPQPAAAAGGATGPYFLFDGAEVMAKHEGVFQRVVGVSRRSLELEVGTETETVPIRALEGYRTMRATKFSSFQANIDRLRGGSLRIALDREMAELEFGATSNIRRQESALALDKADLMLSQMALGPRATDAARQSEIEEKSERIDNLRDVMDDYTRNRPDDLERNTTASGFEPTSVRDLPFDYEYDSLADGLELRCVISTPLPVDDAFVAVTVRYVDARQAVKRGQALELKSIGRLGKKARKVTIEVRNLPRGFHLIGCTFNVYAGGQEIATNLSKNQVELNAEQLYQHFLRAYLTRHRGATRPPGFMLLAPSDELRKKLKATKLQQMIYAEIALDGAITSLSADPGGETTLTSQVLSVLDLVRFFPALREGSAVEGRIQFKLSDLLEL